MEQVELRVHNHPLLRFARFYDGRCAGCSREGYFYGGYRCNELGCDTVFHKECAESKPEISHHAHPEHPLKLFMKTPGYKSCPVCKKYVWLGYSCSICDFSLHLVCARISAIENRISAIENHKVHEHPLEPSKVSGLSGFGDCRECKFVIRLDGEKLYYECRQCNLYIHSTCLEVLLAPDANHSSHPKHPLKNLKLGAPSYADNKCLLCGIKFQDELFNREMNELHQHQKVELYHCDVCNCIDLPRIININRHDHRVSYTWHLGHGNRNCGVCRKTVDGFYGAYSCSKCPNYVVHSLCATRKDVWDMVEVEGTPEEEEIPPFEMIDENTIKHMSHDHDLILNKNGRILHESKLCEACVFQINTDPFYSCEQCSFIIHQACAVMPRKKRHVLCNIPFTLQTSDSKDSFRQRKECTLCLQYFTGFAYIARDDKVMDVRCGSIFEPFSHESHPHPLYYKSICNSKCDACETTTSYQPHMFRDMLCCDECEFSLHFRCATLTREVMKQRYDDHPLYLSYNDNNVDGDYWCDVCEKR